MEKTTSACTEKVQFNSLNHLLNKTAPHESHAQKLSFEWSHFMISPTDYMTSFNHLVQHAEQHH